MTQTLTQFLKPTLVAGLLALSSPAMAEETAPKVEEGAEMMSRGFQMLMDGLAQEMAPLAEDMAEELAEQMQEGWAQLRQEMGDMTAYHPPEVLPNGDILIRRKSPDLPAPEGTPDTPPENTSPDGVTDL